MIITRWLILTKVSKNMAMSAQGVSPWLSEPWGELESARGSFLRKFLEAHSLSGRDSFHPGRWEGYKEASFLGFQGQPRRGSVSTKYPLFRREWRLTPQTKVFPKRRGASPILGVSVAN